LAAAGLGGGLGCLVWVLESMEFFS
jgi:hypothetical protein